MQESSSLLQRLWQMPSTCLIGLVRFYQRGISPLLGKNCRFQPSCSQYTIEAIRKYGAISGMFRGLWRIMRCHPFTKGGFDPP